MAKRNVDVNAKMEDNRRLLQLAEQGSAEAQNALAARLAQGYFMKVDPAGALYWYAQAVKQGYTHAKWNAGTMLLHGEGVDHPDVALGTLLIRQAAAAGETSAQYFMAAREGIAVRAGAAVEEFGDPIDIEEHGVKLIKPMPDFSAPIDY